MTQQGARDRREHDLGRRRGDARDVHAGRLRVPRGGADADEERRPRRGEERARCSAIASIVYYLVGFGIAFGDGGNGLVGGSGFCPVGRRAARGRRGAVQLVRDDPRPARATCSRSSSRAVSLAIVWGAMAERTKLWVYFAFGVVFTLIYSVVSHWIWSPDGWLFAKGMQDFAGSTVVHYQGALAALAGALLLGPRIGKFGRDGKPNAIPGHNMAFVDARRDHPLVRLVRLQPGLDARRRHRRQIGYFAYVALTTNLAAAAGVLGAVITSWIVIKKPDLSMMLNGVDRGARRDHRRVRVRRAVGRDRDRRRRRRRSPSLGVLARRADRHRRPDRRGRGARHVGRLGNARDRHLRGARARGQPCDRHGRALSTRAASTSSACRRSGSSPSARSRSRASFGVALGDEGDCRDPRGAGGRDGRARRVRARHVGLPRVLHPGPGRLRDRGARPPRPRARAARARHRPVVRRRRRSSRRPARRTRLRGRRAAAAPSRPSRRDSPEQLRGRSCPASRGSRRPRARARVAHVASRASS